MHDIALDIAKNRRLLASGVGFVDPAETTNNPWITAINIVSEISTENRSLYPVFCRREIAPPRKISLGWHIAYIQVISLLRITSNFPIRNIFIKLLIFQVIKLTRMWISNSKCNFHLYSKFIIKLASIYIACIIMSN